jgi:hypothetical protein
MSELSGGILTNTLSGRINRGKNEGGIGKIKIQKEGFSHLNDLLILKPNQKARSTKNILKDK